MKNLRDRIENFIFKLEKLWDKISFKLFGNQKNIFRL